MLESINDLTARNCFLSRQNTFNNWNCSEEIRGQKPDKALNEKNIQWLNPDVGGVLFHQIPQVDTDSSIYDTGGLLVEPSPLNKGFNPNTTYWSETV